MDEFNLSDSIISSLEALERNIDIIPPFMLPVLCFGLSSMHEFIKANKN